VYLTEKLKKAGFTTIIVDDGSGKKYSKFFKLAEHYATVLTSQKNKGKGCALKKGLQYIKDQFPENSIVVTLDSDGQHTVKDALQVSNCAEANPGCMLLGSRSFSGNVPVRSRFGNKITQFVYRISTGTRIKDTQTGLRAFTSDLIPFLLNVEGERYEYEMNVLLECSHQNIPITEVGIETIYIDNNSASHFDTFKDSFRIYREILKFAASSFTGFLIDYIMYSILVIATGGLGTSISIPLSNILARITSASVNFSLNKKYVFKNKDSILRTAIQYFILAAIILAGNTLFLSYLVNSLYMNKFVAKIGTEIIFFTLSWLVQKFIIFRQSKKNDKENTRNSI
jgi:putative flippase GtrA